MRRRVAWLGLASAMTLIACGDDANGDDLSSAGGIGLSTAGDGMDGGTNGNDGGTAGGADDESGGDGQACNDGSVDFTFIWVANSPEGTVSKIDTRTAAEVARYRTGPEDNPDPSRTAVELTGDVAVLNRAGSVTKIAALLERCVDGNANGTIETSSGPDDVLPWGTDECVLWHQTLPHYEPTPGDHVWGARPVAWDAGEPNPEDSCDRGPARLWVGWYEGNRSQRRGVLATRRYERPDPWTRSRSPSGRSFHWTRRAPTAARWIRDGNFWVLGKPYQLLRIDGARPSSPSCTSRPQRTICTASPSNGQGRPWLAQCDGRVRWYDEDADAFKNVGDARRLPAGAGDRRGGPRLESRATIRAA